MNLETNFSLSQHNSFKMEAKAQFFAALNAVEDIEALLLHRQKNNPQSAIKIIGDGTNILLTQNIAGYVLKNNISFLEPLPPDNDFYYLKVGGGV